VHEVVIIGAGAAGVGAAYGLSRLGIPYVMLESRDRIGGRMHTVDLDGACIHLGANYIHAPDQTHSILRVM
jgi:monoamine oxidase